MKAAVIGYGSIGRRHVTILSSLVDEVAVVSRRTINIDNHYNSIEVLLDQFDPDYIVIANETSEHFNTLLSIQKSFKGTILVEKPIFHKELPIHFLKNKENIFVAYNLRFHPVIQKLSELLKNKKIISVNINVGQYLPTWRPGTDYSQSYSASKKKGGGVLRDLSHELDYTLWLFGDWESLVALGGNYSDLDIDSDDVFTVFLQTKRCSNISIHMNYLNRIPKREIIINTTDSTIVGDLIENKIQINDNNETYDLERNDTYIWQHKDIIEGKREIVCDFEQGYKVLELIRRIEISSSQRKWITK